MPRQPSRFAVWRARLSERLAHSSQFFLFGLIVACGIEVLVDWNQTLFEVNVLRDQIRQKGLNSARACRCRDDSAIPTDSRSDSDA